MPLKAVGDKRVDPEVARRVDRIDGERPAHLATEELLRLARGAVSNDVEGVRRRREALFGREVVDHRGDGPLELGARRDVDDLAAERAEKW